MPRIIGGRSDSGISLHGDKAKRDSSREWRRDTACQGNQNQPVRGSKALRSTRNIVTDEENRKMLEIMCISTYIYGNRERENGEDEGKKSEEGISRF